MNYVEWTVPGVELTYFMIPFKAHRATNALHRPSNDSEICQPFFPWYCTYSSREIRRCQHSKIHISYPGCRKFISLSRKHIIVFQLLFPLVTRGVLDRVLEIRPQSFRRASFSNSLSTPEGTRYVSEVGWGSALQVGTSRVRFPVMSLEFFIDIILLAVLCSWGRLSL